MAEITEMERGESTAVEERDQWDVQQEEIVGSHSALSLHRRCPQAWYYRYDQRLSKPDTGPKPELHFGRWWAALKAAEAIERGRIHESLRQEPRSIKAMDDDPRFKYRMEEVTTSDIFRDAEVWWREQSEDVKASWQERMGWGLPEALPAVFKRWQERWAEEREHERPLGVEVFWKRELPRPEGDKRWDGDTSGMPKILLLGYIDEVYWDERKRMVVVRDDKTGKDLGTASSISDMLDSQLQFYAWGVAPLLAEWGMEAPRAVAYDRSRSKKGTTPKLLQSGKLSGTVTQFDLDLYLEWAKGPDGQGVPYKGAKKDGSEAGFYTAQEAMIQKLSSESWRSIWNQRTLTPLSRQVVRTHLRGAVDEATDIWRTMKRADAAGEAARRVSKDNCKWCDYQSICRAQMFGGADGQYELAEHGLRAKDGRRFLEITPKES